MKSFFFIIVSFFSILVNAQSKKQIQLVVGSGINGSGDIRGYGFSVEYSKGLTKRFDWTASIGSNLHDGSFPLFFEYPAGTWVDGSIRYTTAGIQAAYLIGYDFIKSANCDLKFKIGGLLRFQSTSYYDDVTINYPGITGLDYPAIIFRNSNPQQTVSTGLMTNISVSHKVSKKISLGLIGSFQFDTNGDSISQLSISISRHLF